MKEIPDSSVDMVLVDPPFGTTCNKWDSVIPMNELWEQYHRICKTNAAVLIFGQVPYSAILMMSNMQELRYEWIYEKSNAKGFLNAKKMPLKAHESIFVFYRAFPTYNPQFTIGKPYKRSQGKENSSNYHRTIRQEDQKSDGKRYPRDVIKISNSSSTCRGLHPTQKPVELLEYFIRTYTNEGETVLDNCMGSGSTGVACFNTGRNFIGIELDDGYFEIAQDRIHKLWRDRNARS